MEKIEKKTKISMEYGLLGEKFDLFNRIAQNQDERWEKNQWDISDFGFTVILYSRGRFQFFPLAFNDSYFRCRDSSPFFWSTR